MSKREDLAYRVGVRYYVEGETMESIARSSNVSRSTVSRLLKDARAMGFVHIALYPPEGISGEISGWFRERWDVRAHIVPVSGRVSERRRLEIVAASGADVLNQHLKPNSVVGVAWGNTVSEVGRQLKRRALPGVEIVQLNGSVNSGSTGLPHSSEILEYFGSAFGARVHHFPVPAFFDFSETKDQLWKETSVRAVLAMQERCDLAIFGAGARHCAIPSMVYSGGFLSLEDKMAIEREGVVGDICTVLMRGDGSWEDLDLNCRASGPLPPQLRTIETRICVAAGVGRIPVVVAALRAHLVTDLVIDEDAAARVKDLIQREDGVI